MQQQQQQPTLVTGIDPGLRNTGVCQYNLQTGRVVRVALYDMAEGFEEREDRSLTKLDHVIRRVSRLALTRPIFLGSDEVRVEYQFEGLYSIAIHAAFVAALTDRVPRVRTVFKESVHAQFRDVFGRGRGNASNKTSAVIGGSARLCAADLALMARLGHANHCYDALYFCLYDPSISASASRSKERKRRASTQVSSEAAPSAKKKKAQSKKQKTQNDCQSMGAKKKKKKTKATDRLRQTSLLDGPRSKRTSTTQNQKHVVILE